jgi:hypothetical protein
MQLPPSQEALKLFAKLPAPLCNASMASNVAAVLLCGHSLRRTSFVPAKGCPELAFHLTPLPHLPRCLSQLQFLQIAEWLISSDFAKKFFRGPEKQFFVCNERIFDSSRAWVPYGPLLTLRTSVSRLERQRRAAVHLHHRVDTLNHSHRRSASCQSSG